MVLRLRHARLAVGTWSYKQQVFHSLWRIDGIGHAFLLEESDRIDAGRLIAAGIRRGNANETWAGNDADREFAGLARELLRKCAESAGLIAANAANEVGIGREWKICQAGMHDRLAGRLVDHAAG